MKNTKQVLHNATGRKRGRPPGKNRKTIMKEQMKERQILSQLEKWLNVYLLPEENQIDVLLTSLGSMLTITRDLMIQNNNTIPIEWMRSLQNQNETICKNIKMLEYIIIQKIKIGVKVFSDMCGLIYVTSLKSF